MKLTLVLFLCIFTSCSEPCIVLVENIDYKGYEIDSIFDELVLKTTPKIGDTIWINGIPKKVKLIIQ